MMRTKFQMLLLATLMLSTPNVFGATFDWLSGTANWDDASAWSGAPVAADFDGTNATTFAATAGTLQADNSPATTNFDTFGAELTLDGNGSISSYSGATLLVTRTAVVTAPNAAVISDLHLNGGRLSFQSANNDTTYSGAISVDADSVLLSNKATHWKGTISGTGNLDYAGTNSIRFFAIESPAANSFSGDWDITAGGLRNSVAGGLGTGAVTVRSGATLEVYGSIDSTSSVTMESGSTLQFHSTGTYDIGDLILEGASITRQTPNNAIVTLQNGTISVNENSTINNPKVSTIWTLRFNTQLTGASDLTIDGNNGIVDINADNDAGGYTGDWFVKDGILRLQNANGLGVAGAGSLTIDQSVNIDARVEFDSNFDIDLAGLTFIDNLGTIVPIQGSPEGTDYDIATDSFAGLDFSDFFNGTGTVTVFAEAAAVPEPSALGLLGLGLLLGVRSRRKRGVSSNENRPC